jgi:hypothetical protein
VRLLTSERKTDIAISTEANVTKILANRDEVCSAEGTTFLGTFFVHETGVGLALTKGSPPSAFFRSLSELLLLAATTCFVRVLAAFLDSRASDLINLTWFAARGHTVSEHKVGVLFAFLLLCPGITCDVLALDVRETESRLLFGWANTGSQTTSSVAVTKRTARARAITLHPIAVLCALAVSGPRATQIVDVSALTSVNRTAVGNLLCFLFGLDFVTISPPDAVVQELLVGFDAFDVVGKIFFLATFANFLELVTSLDLDFVSW